MASIIKSKINSDHVVLSLRVDFEEAKTLNGHLINIDLVAEDNEGELASVTERGKKGHTKYFLIPRKLRSGLNIKEAKCIKIEKRDKVIFAYIMEKV